MGFFYRNKNIKKNRWHQSLIYFIAELISEILSTMYAKRVDLKENCICIDNVKTLVLYINTTSIVDNFQNVLWNCFNKSIELNIIIVQWLQYRACNVQSMRLRIRLWLLFKFIKLNFWKSYFFIQNMFFSPIWLILHFKIWKYMSIPVYQLMIITYW